MTSITRTPALRTLVRTALVATLAFAAVPAVVDIDAHAGGRIGKSMKYGDEVAEGLVKWGTAAQKKRGIVGGVGRASHGVGKAGKKATGYFGKVTKDVGKVVGGTALGGGLIGGYMLYNEKKNEAIDNGTKGCRGKVCDVGRDVLKFITP
jgi:hypothetical protein